MDGDFDDSDVQNEYALNNDDDFSLSVSLKKSSTPGKNTAAQERLKKIQE